MKFVDNQENIDRGLYGFLSTDAEGCGRLPG
jgi:hypothetical protein